MAYRAFIHEGINDFPMRRVRLYVDESFEAGYQRVWLNDATWWDRPAGDAALPPDEVEAKALYLPRQALEPLADELDRFLRGATHKGTEAAVLREWLDAERKRNAELTTMLTGRVWTGPESPQMRANREAIEEETRKGLRGEQ